MGSINRPAHVGLQGAGRSLRCRSRGNTPPITAARAATAALTSCGRCALGWVGLHPAHQVLAAKQLHTLAVEHAGPVFHPALAAQRLGEDHQRVCGLILQRGARGFESRLLQGQRGAPQPKRCCRTFGAMAAASLDQYGLPGRGVVQPGGGGQAGRDGGRSMRRRQGGGSGRAGVAGGCPPSPGVMNLMLQSFRRCSCHCSCAHGGRRWCAGPAEGLAAPPPAGGHPSGASTQPRQRWMSGADEEWCSRPCSAELPL